MYLLIAVKAGKVVRIHHPDVASAFASARRLRALGWETKVKNPGGVGVNLYTVNALLWALIFLTVLTKPARKVR